MVRCSLPKHKRKHNERVGDGLEVRPKLTRNFLKGEGTSGSNAWIVSLIQAYSSSLTTNMAVWPASLSPLITSPPLIRVITPCPPRCMTTLPPAFVSPHPSQLNASSLLAISCRSARILSINICLRFSPPCPWMHLSAVTIWDVLIMKPMRRRTWVRLWALIWWWKVFNRCTTSWFAKQH